MKKKERRFESLLSKYMYTTTTPEDIDKEPYYKRIYKYVREVYLVGRQLGYTDDEIKKAWLDKKQERRVTEDYSKNKPLKKRKDNQTVYNSNTNICGEKRKCSDRNIRFPKKCRKTAWKRFFKLFPDRAPGYKKPEEVLKRKEALEEDEYTAHKRAFRAFIEADDISLQNMNPWTMIDFMVIHKYMQWGEEKRIMDMYSSDDKEMAALGKILLAEKAKDFRQWLRKPRKARASSRDTERT